MCSGDTPSYKAPAKTAEKPPEAPPELVDITLGTDEKKTSKKTKMMKRQGTKALAIPLTTGNSSGLGSLTL